MRAISDLRSVIYNWLENLRLAGLINVADNQSIIRDNQKGPRPERDMITYGISAMTRLGQDDVAYFADSTTGQVQIFGNREFTVNIEAIGDDGLGNLEVIRSSLERQSIISYFFENNVAFVDTLLDIVDITGLVDETRERRYQMDLLFRFTQEQFDPDLPTDPAEYIATVEVDRTIKVCDETLTDDTFTITSE